MIPKNVQMPNPNPKYKPPGTTGGGRGGNMSKCRYCKLCGWANDGDKDFFGWCELRLDSYDIDEPRGCPDYIRATNADRIRAMSDEELATMLFDYKECSKKCIMNNGKHCYEICEEESVILKWLQQPAEEET